MLAKFKLEEREPIRATFSINKVVSAEKVEKALAEEIERATSAEDQLREDLIAENNRAITAEESLQENINSEKTRAESVEADLSANLLAEKERAESVEADISGTLAAEVNRLDLEDGRLNNQIQVAFETIEENKEKTETVINGLAQDIETLDDKVEINTQNITNLNNNLEALTGEVENIAGELDGKQPLGDYALKSDITGFATSERVDEVESKIPDVSGFATNERVDNLDKEIKGDYALKSDVPVKVSELDNDNNYTTETEVAQMIASIPQFEVKIVQELPLTGESMILYMVPKIGTTGDVYDEFIWITATNSFELVGSTTVDLTDYVKNTDYASSTKGGVIKVGSTQATFIDNNGSLKAQNKTLSDYTNLSTNAFIGKGTLENIKEDLVTSVGDTKYQTIGDYATNTALTNGLATKQATISDLSTIRTQASNSVQYNTATDKGLYLSTHPELQSNGVIIPFINNDIAFINKRGGTLTFARRTEDGEFETYTQTNADRVINGKPDYCMPDPRGYYEFQVTLVFPKIYAWSSIVYLDMGTSSTLSEYIKLEYKNSEGDWVQHASFNNTKPNYYTSISAGANGLVGLRFTLRPKNKTGQYNFRIAQIGLINYDSQGSNATLLGLGGGTLYGDVNFANGKLVDYVKNTDYATSSTGGVIKATGNYALGVSSSGNLYARTITDSDYSSTNTSAFIGKGTLENIKESLVTSVGDSKYQPTITKTSNNQSGSIKYSDGRMEQWGLATTSNTGESEFTMSASFMDTNYQVFVEPRQAGDLVHYAIPSAVNKFKARIQNTSGTYMACQFQWRAYGFWK